MQARLKGTFSRTLLIVAVVALLGGGLWLLLRPAQVTTVEVMVRRIAPAIQGVGTVEAKVMVQLAAKITGGSSA
jgi:multidrug efflux pump subunit AcrA (membrane-fusion protein)